MLHALEQSGGGLIIVLVARDGFNLLYKLVVLFLIYQTQKRKGDLDKLARVIEALTPPSRRRRRRGGRKGRSPRK